MKTCRTSENYLRKSKLQHGKTSEMRGKMGTGKGEHLARYSVVIDYWTIETADVCNNWQTIVVVWKSNVTNVVMTSYYDINKCDYLHFFAWLKSLLKFFDR